MSGVMPHFLLYDFMPLTGTVPVYLYCINFIGEMDVRADLSALRKEKTLRASLKRVMK